MITERVLFINIIKQCNMHCDRCYLTESSRKNGEILEFATLERILTSSWARDCNLTLIWEGGEASLAGRKHFRDMVKKASEICPSAKQTMVSNLFNLPNWLIKLSHEYFEGKIETTLALDGKYDLAKNRDNFLKKFKDNYIKAKHAKLFCPINLELNDHTVNLGAPALVDFLTQLGECRVEFDVSVDFETFLAEPAYTLHGYPILPLTTSYANFSSFVSKFNHEINSRGLDCQITSSIIDEMRNGLKSSMFGIQRSSDFLTINPDGNITTNPLFSDLRPTYLGNVKNEDIEIILNGQKRSRFIRHEIRKTVGCMDCQFFDLCAGGPSHAATFDGSGECAGMKKLRTDLQGTSK